MKSLSLSTPHVVFIIGTPGAGKTYFASKFADMFSAPFVESDKLRAAIATPPTYSPEEQHVVEYLSWLQISELLKTKKTFIVEGGTEAKVDRQNLAKLATRRSSDLSQVALTAQKSLSCQKIATITLSADLLHQERARRQSSSAASTHLPRKHGLCCGAWHSQIDPPTSSCRCPTAELSKVILLKYHRP
ncbi:MAG: hypothetical protein UY35_C0001G0061 [Candidatus Saccharibacteria bacterium GW2011_GWC2_48_9]|nr:MAG: hypothetical protein UY35_C0001G0061 [Candidatus Saccharibacteria bacterium GW2011_GWC2_48_9]